MVGQRWRGSVTPWGALNPDDGSARLDWWVAAEDRWHTPADEPSCRQHLVEGTPVVETAIRVPGGDAVQRTYAVADHGGLTIVEMENRSPASFAVALSRRDLLTSRAPSAVLVHGVDAPADALVLPVGHRTKVRVALSHDGRGAGRLPAALPSPEQVVQGWLAQTSRSLDLRLPPLAPTVPLVSLRSALLLDGPGNPADDEAAYLVGLGELARLGAVADQWLDDAVVAAEAVGRRFRRAAVLPWAADAGLAAMELLAGVGDGVVVEDVVALRSRLPPPEPTPLEVPAGPLALAWAQRRMALATVHPHAQAPPAGAALDPASPAGIPVDLLPAPYPPAWVGQSVEAYRVPAGPATVDLAVRWHGHRPALLWEAQGPPVVLSCSGLDPAWSSTEPCGEALLAPTPVPVDRDLR